MKNVISLLFLILIFLSKIQSQMTEEERERLLNKVTKPLSSIKKKTQVYSLINFYSDSKEIKYSSSKIKEVINKYNFPDNYNFISEETPTVNIKNQESCGSCWAFSSTTALAYRYHKIGIDVDLSPQYLLSCYIRDCDEGDELIDPQLSLAKNGTVTETCFPYVSGDKKIPNCPSTCKNGEQFKRYYSKNVYTTFIDFNEENYYDIVATIMDQLINYGPVSSSIKIYYDFYKLKNAKQCSNIIYKYDGTSNFNGGHAVVIVGYGYENSKYYWLIQNSWGETFCDKGFAKIEFGQIGIERVAFSEPDTSTASTNSTSDISVNMILNEDCNMKFTTNSEDEDNSFEMEFKNADSSDESNSNFYYQCGIVNLKGKKEGLCFYNMDAFNNSKGYYKYDSYKSLKNNNVFNIDLSALSNNQFYYHGDDYIDSWAEDENILYVSDAGSKIFLFDYTYKIGDLKIYPNENSKTPLSNCKTITLDEENFLYGVYCEITQDELNNFDASNNSPLVYDIFCGAKEKTSAVVRKLDKSNYPIFNIQKIIVTERSEMLSDSLIVLKANIEGSISKVKGNNQFALIINYYKKGRLNYKGFLYCEIPTPKKLENNFEIECYPDIDDGYYVPFDSISIYGYNIPVKTNYPFEIIMENNFQPVYDENYGFNSIRKNSSNYIKFSFLLSCILLLLL